MSPTPPDPASDRPPDPPSGQPPAPASEQAPDPPSGARATPPSPRADLRGHLPRAWAIARVLVRLQATRGRLLLALGATVVLAVAAAGVGTIGGGALGLPLLLREAVLGLGVPLVALVLASSCLGDLVEDESLVYLWLRPLPRTSLAVAAFAASGALVVPLNLTMTAVVAVLGGTPVVLAPALAAVALVSIAYVAVFVGLGLRTKRSLLWGLAYVLLLEGFLARFSPQLGALSLRRYAESVLDGLRGVQPELATTTSAAVLLGVTAAGIAATAWWLTSRDVA